MKTISIEVNNNLDAFNSNCLSNLLAEYLKYRSSNTLSYSAIVEKNIYSFHHALTLGDKIRWATKAVLGSVCQSTMNSHSEAKLGHQDLMLLLSSPRFSDDVESLLLAVEKLSLNRNCIEIRSAVTNFA